MIPLIPRLLLMAIACAAASAGDVAADSPGPPQPQPDRPVDLLANPVHGTWRRSTVADVAARLAEDGGLPIVVDRRIDFTRRLDLDGEGRPLGEVLDELAEKAAASAVLAGSHVRIAPPEAAARVAAFTAGGRRFESLPKTTREMLAAAAPLVIEAGEPPREVVERLARASRLALGGLDLMPHDHLPAVALPPMPLADRLDVVLAHYDLVITAIGDRQASRLVVSPLETPPGPAAPVPPVPQVPPVPKLATLAEGRAVAPAVPIDRFTLRTDAALDELLAVIARRLGLRLSLDHESLARKGVAAKEIVRLSVRDVSRDGLLDAVTRPIGLEWTIEGERLVVR